MFKLLQVFTLFFGVFVSLCFYNGIRFRYSLNNAVLRTLLTALEDTRWADGFSESKFSEILTGMSMEQVTSILGEPLRKTCLIECEWVYSWQKDSIASFDWRSVHFDSQGRVDSKRRDFFID